MYLFFWIIHVEDVDLPVDFPIVRYGHVQTSFKDSCQMITSFV